MERKKETMKWFSQVLDAMRIKSYSELKEESLPGYNAAEVIATPFPLQWIDPNLCCAVGKAGGRAKVNGILSAVEALTKSYPDLDGKSSVRIVRMMKDVYEAWRSHGDVDYGNPQSFPSTDFKVVSWWYALLGPNDVKKVCGWLDKMEADLWRCVGQIRAVGIVSGSGESPPEDADVEMV